MNSSLPFHIVFLFFICFCTRISVQDYDNLHDTCPTSTTGKQTVFINGFTCKNPANVSASDFKTSNLNQIGNTDNFYRSSVTIVTAADFPGLNTLGLSIARTDLDVDGLVLAHSHPRASEMLFVNKGVVIVGFIDSGSNLFQKLLKEVFNSQNPGMVSFADAMFEQLDSDLKDKLVRRLIPLPGSKG
ncbi:hypothetical protein I3760_12G000100 [Carya illinoinensis]|nr:hypothetical protein I3760_12G000100 [Carya illinoinensis]